MHDDERARSRLELDERARSARRCLEEAERELALEHRHAGLRDWLHAVMRHDAVRRDRSSS
jgi:hypothetical protein